MKQRAEPESYLRDIIYRFAHQIEEMIWQMNWRGVNITANKTDYFTRIVTGKRENIPSTCGICPPSTSNVFFYSATLNSVYWATLIIDLSQGL